MNCNVAGIALVQEFEGCKLTAYQDQGGRWTIGFGCAQPFVHEGVTCTEDQATAWLVQDMDEVAKSLTRIIKIVINDNEFSALCSWAYNVGIGNAADSTLIKLLNRGYIDLVPVQLSRWNRVNGIINAGLVRRRQAEIALFNTP